MFYNNYPRLKPGAFKIPLYGQLNGRALRPPN